MTPHQQHNPFEEKQKKAEEYFESHGDFLISKKNLVSKNYVPKQEGWKVSANGKVEINDIAYGILDMHGGAVEGLNYVSGNSGGIDFNEAGRVQVSTYFDPTGQGTYNTGGADRYWADISYKTLTDRGCLGWYDEGVKLRDGTIVTDLEALRLIQKHPTLTTPAGAPRLDYTTLPQDVYVPPRKHDGTEFPKDENGEYYSEYYDMNQKKIVRVTPHEGAETTALISILLGAIKELDKKVTDQDAEIKKLKGV